MSDRGALRRRLPAFSNIVAEGSPQIFAEQFLPSLPCNLLSMEVYILGQEPVLIATHHTEDARTLMPYTSTLEPPPFWPSRTPLTAPDQIPTGLTLGSSCIPCGSGAVWDDLRIDATPAQITVGQDVNLDVNNGTTDNNTLSLQNLPTLPIHTQSEENEVVVDENIEDASLNPCTVRDRTPSPPSTPAPNGADSGMDSESDISPLSSSGYEDPSLEDNENSMGENAVGVDGVGFAQAQNAAETVASPVAPCLHHLGDGVLDGGLWVSWEVVMEQNSVQQNQQDEYELWHNTEEVQEAPLQGDEQEDVLQGQWRCNNSTLAISDFYLNLTLQPRGPTCSGLDEIESDNESDHDSVSVVAPSIPDIAVAAEPATVAKVAAFVDDGFTQATTVQNDTDSTPTKPHKARLWSQATCSMVKIKTFLKKRCLLWVKKKWWHSNRNKSERNLKW
ncbi:hypothetical protein HK102_006497 [Quaeritorhiza haematococci]|nr:hypothetical protein HK102_006497 [Quaeritorhiza haematococci]